MAWWSGPDIKAVLILKSRYVKLFSEKVPEGEVLEVPQNAVKFQEVVDKGQLNTLVKRFLLKFKIKKVVVVLSTEMAYEKVIQISEGISKDMVDGFFEQVPLPKEQIGRRFFLNKLSIVLMAINKIYLEAVLEAAHITGIQTTAVIPGIVLPQADFDKVNFEDLKFNLRKKGLLENMNLLKGSEKEEVVWKRVEKYLKLSGNR